jgi:hypothetical protein
MDSISWVIYQTLEPFRLQREVPKLNRLQIMIEIEDLIQSFYEVKEVMDSW